MTNKLLAELEFGSIISEAVAQTQTGVEFLDKYKSYMLANEASCKVVNNFLREANMYNYDNGVHTVAEKVADYIQSNKTSWALHTVCESLNNSCTSYNYLNKAAVKQVESLLENDEETVNKYIKAGALKNVMYVTEFRNVAKQVFHDTPMVESTAEYKMVRPISFIESLGDGYQFFAGGKVIKVAADNTITEGNWNETSNTFKTINNLLNSNICSFDETSESLTVNVNNVEYVVEGCDKCKKCTKKDDKKEEKEMTAEGLRENNRLVLMATNPRFRNQVAGVLEAIALTCENFDHVAKMDNTGVYETRADRFLVVNEGTNMFVTSLASNHQGPWTVSANVVEALESIKKYTRVTLSEKFTDQVKQVIEQASEEDKAKIENDLKEAKKEGIRKRIEALTEQYKDDPTKLAILSQCAQDLQTAEE